jgi:hypothetical protein
LTELIRVGLNDLFDHMSNPELEEAGEIYDPFLGLRNELELDLKKFSAEHFEKIAAILITGDVAYSGHPDEYAFATTWIEKIAKSIGLDPKADVYLIPGNHDIERKVVEGSPTIQGYHATLRSPNKDVNESLVAYLEKDEEAKRIIFKPLKNFNDFAAKFQCDSSAEHPYWEHPFKLNDGSTLMVRGSLRICGMNSRPNSLPHSIVWLFMKLQHARIRSDSALDMASAKS